MLDTVFFLDWIRAWYLLRPKESCSAQRNAESLSGVLPLRLLGATRPSAVLHSKT